MLKKERKKTKVFFNYLYYSCFFFFLSFSFFLQQIIHFCIHSFTQQTMNYLGNCFHFPLILLGAESQRAWSPPPPLVCARVCVCVRTLLLRDEEGGKDRKQDTAVTSGLQGHRYWATLKAGLPLGSPDPSLKSQSFSIDSIWLPEHWHVFARYVA